LRENVIEISWVLGSFCRRKSQKIYWKYFTGNFHDFSTIFQGSPLKSHENFEGILMQSFIRFSIEIFWHFLSKKGAKELGNFFIIVSKSSFQKK
jgi:hypothetical protein